MKKIISLFLTAIFIILSITGCEENEKEPKYETIDPKVAESLEKHLEEEAEKQRIIDAKYIIQNENVYSAVTLETKRYNKFLGIEKDVYYIDCFGVIVSETTEYGQTVKHKRIILTTYEHAAKKYDKYKYQEYTITDCSGKTYNATLLHQSPDLNLAIFAYQYQPSQYDFYMKPIGRYNKNPKVGDEVIYMSKERGIEFLKCKSYEIQVWNTNSGIEKFRMVAGDVKLNADNGGILFDEYGRDMVGLCTRGISSDDFVSAIPIEDIVNYLNLLGY